MTVIYKTGLLQQSRFDSSLKLYDSAPKGVCRGLCGVALIFSALCKKEAVACNSFFCFCKSDHALIWDRMNGSFMDLSSAKRRISDMI